MPPPGWGADAYVGPIWAAEGPATLHLTLSPVVDTGDARETAANGAASQPERTEPAAVTRLNTSQFGGGYP